MSIETLDNKDRSWTLINGQILSLEAFCSGYWLFIGAWAFFSLLPKKKFSRSVFAKLTQPTRLPKCICTKRTAKHLRIPSAPPPEFIYKPSSIGFCIFLHFVRTTGLTTSWFSGWLTKKKAKQQVGKQKSWAWNSLFRRCCNVLT